jgi:hypothetical protein
VIVEQSSNFTGAGFTPEDRYIVATRYTFLAVWDTVTGNPLRVLHSSVSPILRVYTSCVVNKVVTLLANMNLHVNFLLTVSKSMVSTTFDFVKIKHLSLLLTNMISCGTSDACVAQSSMFSLNKSGRAGYVKPVEFLLREA